MVLSCGAGVTPHTWAACLGRSSRTAARWINHFDRPLLTKETAINNHQIYFFKSQKFSPILQRGWRHRFIWKNKKFEYLKKIFYLYSASHLAIQVDPLPTPLDPLRSLFFEKCFVLQVWPFVSFRKEIDVMSRWNKSSLSNCRLFLTFCGLKINSVNGFLTESPLKAAWYSDFIKIFSF